MCRQALCLLSCCLFSLGAAFVWQENVRPKMYVQLGADVQRFLGNESYPDCFNLLLHSGNHLLLGARNVVYNLSLTDLTENKRLEWHSSEQDIKMCQMKGKDEEKCQNYIRVLLRTSPTNWLLCGTNAFKPVCRDYSLENGGYKFQNEKGGQGICPFDPEHNSTSIFVDGELYTGTVADFSGSDALIYREPLRTEQYDSMNLNAPHFVNAIVRGDFVYFFFRETAVEYMNCGKSVYSRVARVCKNDHGNPHNFRDRWTSFLKSRLNCSVPGEFPFYFNEIQATTDLVEGTYGGERAHLLYGVFTTPAHSISGSAVCAFRLQDISDTFEGPFKEQSVLNANWLAVKAAKVPEPRPGLCVNDSHTLPDMTLNFIKSHSMMDEAVPPFFGAPIVVRTSLHYRFTKIAVDPQVKTPDGKAYDVLFIGTDNGKVFKAVNAISADLSKEVDSVVIEEIQVFPTHIPVRNLQVIRSSDNVEDAKLIVISDHEVLALKLQRCYSDKITSCSDCVALQDPYCAWDKVHQKCRTVGSPRWSAGSGFIQSVRTGQHNQCPDGKTAAKSMVRKESSRLVGTSSAQHSSFNHTLTTLSRNVMGGEIVNIVGQEKEPDDFHPSGPSMSATGDTIPMYTVETLAIAIAAGSLAALVVGFLAGYLCGKKCRKEEEDNLPYRDTDYEYFEQQPVHRMAPEPKLLLQEEATYAEPVFIPSTTSSKSLGLGSSSPKGGTGTLTLSKSGGGGPPSAPPPPPSHLTENMFQFGSADSYAPRSSDPMLGVGGPPSFGSLRHHHHHHHPHPHPGDGFGGGGGARRNLGDGYSTTRSVKKVYL